MTRCSVCGRPDLAELDRALLAGHSFRAISRRFGIGKDAVARHANHSKWNGGASLARQPGNGKLHELLLEAQRILSEAAAVLGEVQATQEPIGEVSETAKPEEPTDSGSELPVAPQRARLAFRPTRSAPGQPVLDRLRETLLGRHQ